MTVTVPVLLYHSINERPPPGGTWGAVAPREFRRHLERICALGCQALTVSELADSLRGHRRLPQQPVLITFDDGYADSLVAAGVLRDLGLRATVYVTTGDLDRPGWLSRQQLSDLAACRELELGAHGVNHCHMDELPAENLARELIDSRSELERLTGRRVTSFAYPHGAYDRAVRRAVIAAGYTSAVAVKNAVSHLDDDPFAIARFTVTRAVSADRLEQVLEGQRVQIAWHGERLRTRAARTVRRARARRARKLAVVR